jgi:L-ascorbate metabolism protein UlaG (beta-lactamase superfamily)
MYFTWLDSNSWLIEIAGQRILLDPWLVGSLTFANQAWLFKGDRPQPRPIPDEIDLILLSQGLEDHAHPPTLQCLDRAILVVGSPNAAKVAQELGYTQVNALGHGDTFVLANQVEIQATPGSPLGPFTTENGYLLKDLQEGYTVYYEPHGYHSASLQAIAPVDVVITPIIDLEIPILGPIIKGRKSAPEVVQWLKPQVIMPTAAGGNVEFSGLLMSALRAKGSADELRHFLAEAGLTTRLLEPTPGDRFELSLSVAQ